MIRALAMMETVIDIIITTKVDYIETEGVGNRRNSRSTVRFVTVKSA